MTHEQANQIIAEYRQHCRDHDLSPPAVLWLTERLVCESHSVLKSVMNADVNTLPPGERGAYSNGFADGVASVTLQVSEEPGEGPWKCFHCSEIFTDVDAARDHFGLEQEFMDPGCVARLRETDKEMRHEIVQSAIEMASAQTAADEAESQASFYKQQHTELLKALGNVLREHKVIP